MKHVIILVERDTTDCPDAWLYLEARWIHSKDLPAFFEVRDLKRMWLESGLAYKNRRDYGIEGTFWSEWRD